MGYIEEAVTTNEHILAIYHLNGYALWFGPSVSLGVGALVGLSSLTLGEEGANVFAMAVVLCAYGVWVLVNSFWHWLTWHMGLTDQRVIYKKGLIRRETDELRLAKMEKVDIDQSVLGRIFDYGTLEMTGTGGSSVVFQDIDAPLQSKRAIDEAVMRAKRGEGA